MQRKHSIGNIKKFGNNRKKCPPALFFIEIGTRNILFCFFFCLALHVLGQLQINQTNPFEALFMHRDICWYYK